MSDNISKVKKPFCTVISDTHQVLCEGLLPALQGADRIFHAGDVGSVKILDELEKIAPVYKVRGNVDYKAENKNWDWDLYCEWQGFMICMTHDLSILDLDPVSAKIDLLIHGHTHKPEIEEKNGVLYLNPGSAGQGNRPVFSLSYALFRVESDKIKAEIHYF